ncbi:MAG: class I SAM-dependent methyltransferase [Chitinophagaceae bacterium]|nr:MAG: class I SAM-dependent methyltransferase [Chitinophagaceae bacterium]
MLSKVNQLLWYLKYYRIAKTRFDVHSPFVYEFIEEIIKDKRSFYAFEKVDLLRKKWIKKNESYEYTDLGAGTFTGEKKIRNTKKVIQNQACNAKYGKLLFRLVNFFQPEKILELGTSLGISTAYIALAKSSAQIITIEGCNKTARKAAESFQFLDIENVQTLEGDFEKNVHELLHQKNFIPDFVFIDGNHKGEAIIKYFDLLYPLMKEKDTVIIFDDIRWSGDMYNAWESIAKRPEANLTIDIYKFGLVFFRKGIRKQHFTLRY